MNWSDKGTFSAAIFATNAAHGAFTLMKVAWMYLSTCGSQRKRHDVLGNVAMMVLSWTVATAVFDALDIFATLWYDVETQASISSAVFSTLSILYGLKQRKADLRDLSKIGAPRIGLGGYLKKGGKMLKEKTARLKANTSEQAGAEDTLVVTDSGEERENPVHAGEQVTV